MSYQKLKKSLTSFSLVCELMPFTCTVFDMVAMLLPYLSDMIGFFGCGCGEDRGWYCVVG